MEAKVIGGNLVLTVPLAAPYPSSTGKMNLRYTSGGFKQAARICPTWPSRRRLLTSIPIDEYPDYGKSFFGSSLC